MQAPLASESRVARFLERLALAERARRTMVLDERYATLAAYVSGYDTGAVRLVDGFSAWLSLRTHGRPTPTHWTVLIVERVVTDAAERGDRLWELTPEEDAAACAELFRMLREFVGGDRGEGAVGPRGRDRHTSMAQSFDD